jgi:hypothetical protein
VSEVLETITKPIQIMKKEKRLRIFLRIWWDFDRMMNPEVTVAIDERRKLKTLMNDENFESVSSEERRQNFIICLKFSRFPSSSSIDLLFDTAEGVGTYCAPLCA